MSLSQKWFQRLDLVGVRVILHQGVTIDNFIFWEAEDIYYLVASQRQKIIYKCRSSADARGATPQNLLYIISQRGELEMLNWYMRQRKKNKQVKRLRLDLYGRLIPGMDDSKVQKSLRVLSADMFCPMRLSTCVFYEFTTLEKTKLRKVLSLSVLTTEDGVLPWEDLLMASSSAESPVFLVITSMNTYLSLKLDSSSPYS